MLARELVLLTLSATSSASAINNDISGICGQNKLHQLDIAEFERLQRAEDAGTIKPHLKNIEIDTYFHAVLPNDTSMLSIPLLERQLLQQLYVMNLAYGSHSIHFNLKGTEITINDEWTIMHDELAMKKALRKGDCSTLNIYFVDFLGKDTLGQCALPFNISDNSSGYINDGCSVVLSTLPTGSETYYNFGAVTVHEVGHWFGLLHTFEKHHVDDDPCSGTGDTISDTPPQRNYTTGCPKSIDTCPAYAGLDPIHNFMDYSSGQCLQNFTVGQRTRMYNMFERYRLGK